jgi:tetratricopeptide (TPR) repeat protein
VPLLKTRPDNATRLGIAVMMSSRDPAALSAPERQALAALGAFAPGPEGFAREAAAFVTAVDPAVLDRLVDRQLIAADLAGRLSLAQATAEAATPAAASEAVDRHRRYYLDLARRHAADGRRLDTEYRQIRRAWSAAADEHVFDFVWALRPYHEQRELWDDALVWARRGLDVAEAGIAAAELAQVLAYLGWICTNKRELPAAIAYYERAVPLLRAAADAAGLAKTLDELGVAYFNLECKQQAFACLNEALAVARELGGHGRLANAWNNLGMAHHGIGERQEALACFQAALASAAEARDEALQAFATHNIGLMHQRLGQLEQALEHYQRAQAFPDSVTSAGARGITLHLMGQIHFQCGRLDQALGHFREALAALASADNPHELVKTHVSAGHACRRLGRAQQALEHFQQALQLLPMTGGRSDERTIRLGIATLSLRRGRLDVAAVQLWRLLARKLARLQRQ